VQEAQALPSPKPEAAPTVVKAKAPEAPIVIARPVKAAGSPSVAAQAASAYKASNERTAAIASEAVADLV
jgi:hypothetical protein